MNAMLFVGGWQGHAPHDFADWATQLLQEEGFTVTVMDTLEPLTDPATMRDIDLIVPIWSSARSSHQPEFGTMTKAQEDGLLRAVEAGTGLAGWHGHMADAFRDRPTYHFLIGGQFVAHPPGWPDNPVPSDDFVEYRVEISEPEHPIMAGLEPFTLRSEQYYLLVDPSNHVLATTTFSGEHLPWIDGTVMPVAWTRRWGAGRVFYCSVGHTVADLNVASVRTLVRRGLVWASLTRDSSDL